MGAESRNPERIDELVDLDDGQCKEECDDHAPDGPLRVTEHEFQVALLVATHLERSAID